MHPRMMSLKFLPAFALSLFLLPSLTPAQHYAQKNLVSDLPQPHNPDGSKVLVDPNLKNPWGLTRSSGSPWWISNNNSGTSSLFSGTGTPINIFTESGGAAGNFVVVPPPGFAPAGTQSAPTGVVFNGSPTDFLLNKGTPAGKPAVFIFATEDGTISGWNPGVNISSGGKAPSTNAVLEVDNSDKGSANGAVYKGATSGEINGQRFLYVTNFRSGKVEVYDTNFKPVHLGEDAFDPDGNDDHGGDDRGDDRIPHGFAPFNIQNIGGVLFVTYAKQNAAKHDDVAGEGNGFVEIFTTSGKHIGHLQHGSWLNSPWGVVWTTRDFGEFSNAILVGNFGSGWIAAFNGFTYKFMGFIKNPDDSILTIDGLWSLTFGNDATAGPANTLFFTAGINGEQDGLFGTITPVDGLDGDEE
ncbi:MAG TPA: TIGR03118 family protein [Candidatus Acidoferrum sp.]